MKEAWHVFWEYMATSLDLDWPVEDALDAVHEWESQRPGNHGRLLLIALCVGGGVFISGGFCIGILLRAIMGFYL